ncbi:uncharacterized protein LOC135390949 isoform X2 [Ornithodoros turicata]|uniref:uncharacterized protein LOC135390949 isoform X2 n=1 Tax=Ornithodoros turicata TaxID=34597 RepID=UPI0031386E67
MASPRLLCATLFASCILVACSIIVLALPLLGAFWQVVPDLDTLETGTRIQALFLAFAAVSGLAAFVRRADAQLVPVVACCAVTSAVAALLTGVAAAYKILLLLKVLDEDKGKDLLSNLSAMLLISLLAADAISLLSALICTICTLVYCCRVRTMRCTPRPPSPLLPPRRPRVNISPQSSLTRDTAHTSTKEVKFVDDVYTQPRLFVAPEGAPVIHLSRNPPGTVYALPPGALVMVDYQ